MIRVLAFPYLNAVPFVYGLRQKSLTECITLDVATPDQAADRLQHDACDLAIVPVAAIPLLPRYAFIGNYCIGAVSAVASVLLCSRTPVTQIREVAIDRESRTSVLLAKLLLRDYWQITPRYTPLPTGFPDPCPESVVLIGDKALLDGGRYPYVYDLAEHWIAWTGKPFVFAAWVANKALPDGFAPLFDEALAYGLAHLDEAIDAEAGGRFPKPFAREYLTKNISFSFDEKKQEGLRLFWEVAPINMP